MCHGPTLADLLQKSETDSKGKSISYWRLQCFWDKKRTKPGHIQSEDLFLEITVFLGRTIDKIGTDSKL